MRGKLAPDILKPLPLMDAPLMVSGEFPLDVSVTVLVAGAFSVTSPKATLAMLSVSFGAAAVSCNA